MAAHDRARPALVVAGLALMAAGPAQASLYCKGPARPDPALQSFDLKSRTAVLLGESPKSTLSVAMIKQICEHAQVEIIDRPAPPEKLGKVLAVNPHNQAELAADAAHRVLIYVGRSIKLPMPPLQRGVPAASEVERLAHLGIELELRCEGRGSGGVAEASSLIVDQFPGAGTPVASGQWLDRGLTVPSARALAFVDCGIPAPPSPQCQSTPTPPACESAPPPSAPLTPTPPEPPPEPGGNSTMVLVSGGALAAGWVLARKLPGSPSQPVPPAQAPAGSTAPSRTRVRPDREGSVDG